MHLAQVNVGRLRAPVDEPIIGPFRVNLGQINSLAEDRSGVEFAAED